MKNARAGSVFHANSCKDDTAFSSKSNMALKAIELERTHDIA